jgi:CubicO group peptidase (beta-lactamase class C family)
MSKAFCATATMMLVDEGKISVDDPLEKYIPEFKGDQVIDPKDPTHTPHRPNHPPTIREALSLSTGLPFGGGTGPGGQLDAKPLSAVAAIDGKEPLQFQPGTDFFYSNEGINACARIVEIVSGMPYETFLQQRIFDPLGMKDTTFWPTVEQQQRLAKCYLEKANPKRLEAVPYRQLTYPLEKKEGRYPVASGGLFSTAQDLAKFCQMFLNGGTLGGKQYLSPAAYKMMTTKEAPTKNYGFGWDLDKDGSYGHGGADQTYMGIDPKLGVVEIFLTQVGAPWVGNNIKKMHGVWEDANKEVAKDAAHAAGGHGT